LYMQTKQTTTIMMMFHTNTHKEREEDKNTLSKNRANEMFNGDNNDQNNCAKGHDLNLH
jgi:hypothetical protein